VPSACVGWGGGGGCTGVFSRVELVPVLGWEITVQKNITILKKVLLSPLGKQAAQDSSKRGTQVSDVKKCEAAHGYAVRTARMSSRKEQEQVRVRATGRAATLGERRTRVQTHMNGTLPSVHPMLPLWILRVAPRELLPLLPPRRCKLYSST